MEAVRIKQLYSYSCDGTDYPRPPWATYQSLMSPQVRVSSFTYAHSLLSVGVDCPTWALKLLLLLWGRVQFVQHTNTVWGKLRSVSLVPQELASVGHTYLLFKMLGLLPCWWSFAHGMQAQQPIMPRLCPE